MIEVYRDNEVGEMIQAYECAVKGTDWRTIVHAMSRGQAKSEYLHQLRDSWPDVTFTMVRARCLGAPIQTAGFQRTAAYRGVPEARIGMQVRVGGHLGYIVDTNSSANFDVLFIEGLHRGLRLNCHPHSDMKFVEGEK